MDKSIIENVWVPMRREDLSPETFKTISSVLGKIQQLPLSVRRIIEMASDADIGARELAEAVSSDPVMSSKILMMVNSSYYGLNRKIDNLRLAIVLLGFNEVRNIALQYTLRKVLPASIDNNIYSTRNLWMHSYLVSVCAEYLLHDDDPENKGAIMSMGILHDIGKFALYAIGMMFLEKGRALTPNGGTFSNEGLMRAEEKLFSVNHAIVGAMLADKWNLSERIQSVIEFHHYPIYYGFSEIPPEHIREIAIICLSDLIANRWMHGDGSVSAPQKIFFDLLNLPPSIDSIMNEDLCEKMDNAIDFLRHLDS